MNRHAAGLLRLGLVLAIMLIGIWQLSEHPADPNDNSTQNLPSVGASQAATVLKELPIKGRAPKTGYTREQFSDGWDSVGGCEIRDHILARDMTAVVYEPHTCEVARGTLNDPYTGKTIYFRRGPDTSATVQIDHVVALGDAWQKGAQQLTYAQRHELANDPLELLAVDGSANQQKSDGDAATWLPPNKPYRCSYVARQIAVKKKYSLWVTRSEYDAMAGILNNCPAQALPL
jgi:hypothetical protein